MKVTKPIFITVCPFSGTTIFSELTFYHAELAFFKKKYIRYGEKRL